MRIEKLKQNYDVDIRFVHFPLHPETPAAGMSLDTLFAGRYDDAQRKAMQARMKGLMDAEGLPYGERSHTYNSRLAQELGKWADSQPGALEGPHPRGAIHEALFKAYFVAGRNIGDVEVLVDIAKSVGLAEDEARQVLTERTFKQAVDEDWAASREAGVTGVPTYVAGGYSVVGAQPYEMLERLMAAVGAQRKAG